MEGESMVCNLAGFKPVHCANQFAFQMRNQTARHAIEFERKCVLGWMFSEIQHTLSLELNRMPSRLVPHLGSELVRAVHWLEACQIANH